MATHVGKEASASPLTPEMNDAEMHKVQSPLTNATRETFKRMARDAERTPAPMYAAIQSQQISRLFPYTYWMRPCYQAAFEPSTGYPAEEKSVSSGQFEVASSHASTADGVLWAKAQIAEQIPGIQDEWAQFRRAGASFIGSHAIELTSPMTLHVQAPARVIALGLIGIAEPVASPESWVGFCGYEAELTLRVRSDSGATAMQTIMIAQRGKFTPNVETLYDHIDKTVLLDVSLAVEQSDRLTAELSVSVVVLRSEMGGWAVLDLQGLMGPPDFPNTGQGAVLFDQFLVESASRCRRVSIVLPSLPPLTIPGALPT